MSETERVAAENNAIAEPAERHTTGKPVTDLQARVTSGREQREKDDDGSLTDYQRRILLIIPCL